jgi:hypothetical protein
MKVCQILVELDEQYVEVRPELTMLNSTRHAIKIPQVYIMARPRNS